MEPEEIIQKKEWRQLTEAEKSLLSSLATDEEEYNLLKKMLLVAAEEMPAVPDIGPIVQQRLQRIVAQKPAAHFLKRWHYAAAAILLILVAAWFVFLKKNGEREMAHHRPVSIPFDTLQRRPANTGISARTVIQSKNPENNNTRTIAKIKDPANTEKTPVISPSQDQLAVNTSIGRHPELMALITEVYE